jgi:hypothetical protein
MTLTSTGVVSTFAVLPGAALSEEAPLPEEPQAASDDAARIVAVKHNSAFFLFKVKVFIPLIIFFKPNRRFIDLHYHHIGFLICRQPNFLAAVKTGSLSFLADPPFLAAAPLTSFMQPLPVRKEGNRHLICEKRVIPFGSFPGTGWEEPPRPF